MACGRLKNDGKFIAACAGNGVRVANSPEEKLRDPLQKQIPSVVAVGIVDEFEIVEIDSEQRRLGFGAASALDSSRKTILKQAAIGKASQLVMQRQMFVVLNLLFQHEQD